MTRAIRANPCSRFLFTGFIYIFPELWRRRRLLPREGRRSQADGVPSLDEGKVYGDYTGVLVLAGIEDGDIIRQVIGSRGRSALERIPASDIRYFQVAVSFSGVAGFLVNR